MKLAITTAIAFLIALSFWCGVRWGGSNVLPELKSARQEIEVLKTYKTSQEWYIANEKRKNAAHREYIDEMEGK